MAKFNFRLDNYLSIKEKLEDQKEIEYGLALVKLEEEKQKKMRLLAERDEEIKKFRESLHALIKPADISRYNNWIEVLKKRIIDQERRIVAAEAEAEKKRLELVEAMKDRKMLESIKDQRLEDFKRSEVLAEQKIVDELVSYKYAERDAIASGG